MLGQCCPYGLVSIRNQPRAEPCSMPVGPWRGLIRPAGHLRLETSTTNTSTAVAFGGQRGRLPTDLHAPGCLTDRDAIARLAGIST